MPPRVILEVIPVGGAVGISMPDYVDADPNVIPAMTLSRAVSGVGGLSAWTQLYSGAPTQFWVDPGDALPAPLASGTTYVYQVADATGTTQTAGIVPVASITTVPDGLTPLFIRMMQATVNNLTIPPGSGIKPTQVTLEMPRAGWQALPFILVNMDLIQQTDTYIGQDVENPNKENQWTISVTAKRVWRVTVFSTNAMERDFYRDSLLAAWPVLIATVFAPLGLDVRHNFQAASGTDAKEWEGHVPGFYYADIMLEMDGVFNAEVLTHYAENTTITTTATLPGGAVDGTQLPDQRFP